jgi:hypothetical protein
LRMTVNLSLLDTPNKGRLVETWVQVIQREGRTLPR